MTPLTPFSRGCKASVYRGFAPLHPQTGKFLYSKQNSPHKVQGTLYREELPLGEDWRGLFLKALQPGFQFEQHLDVILERGTHAPAVTACGIYMD